MLVVAAVVVLGTLYVRREARVRWARDVAFPKLVELVELNKYPEAMALAEQIQQVLPDDPKLKKLLPEMSRLYRVETARPARPSLVKPYGAPDDAWRSLGTTPLAPFRLPFGFHLWRITLPGYETVTLAYPSIYAPPEVTLKLALDRAGTIAPGHGARPGRKRGTFHPRARPPAERSCSATTLIDRTEVTNREFKRFVDEGGYRRRELWKEPFVHGGRTLGWEEAMALLHDKTGRPGPATWDLGDYPEGQGDHPVTGVSWYEAAAYAAFVGKQLPTTYEWSHAAGTYAAPQIVPASNFRNAGTVPVATLGAISPYGTQDMAGNAKEWCWNGVKDGRRFILGGGWNEPSYMFNDADAQDPFTRGPSFGFRLVKRLDDRTAPEAVGGHPARPPGLLEGEAGAARGRAGVSTALRLRQDPARRPGRGDRRQLGPLAEGEGQLHRGLRRRARHRLPLDPARRTPSVPAGGALPRLERAPRALEQGPCPGCAC